MFFDENSVANSLAQFYKKLKKEGLDDHIPIGVSKGGYEIVKRLTSAGYFSDFYICRVEHENINILDESSNIVDNAFFENKKILICDDTTLSGKTFEILLPKFKSLKPKNMRFFSLLMRRHSSIVPNLFVFEIENDTKVYFPWSDYPIRSYPKGIVRKICSSDCDKEFKCGVDVLDNHSLSDYYHDSINKLEHVYLIEEDDNICSIIEFNKKDTKHYKGLYLSKIATAEDKKGQRYGSTLIRLILYCMYYHEFDYVYANALDNPQVIKMYKQNNFELVRTLKNSKYGVLHKFAAINDKSNKEWVIGELKQLESSCVENPI